FGNKNIIRLFANQAMSGNINTWVHSRSGIASFGLKTPLVSDSQTNLSPAGQRNLSIPCNHCRRTNRAFKEFSKQACRHTRPLMRQSVGGHAMFTEVNGMV